MFTYLGVLAGISVHSAKTWTPAIQGEECRVASCLGGRDRQSHDERLCCLHQSGTSQAHVDNASGELCMSVCTHAQTLGLLLTDLFFSQEIWGAFVTGNLGCFPRESQLELRCTSYPACWFIADMGGDVR